MTLRDVKHFELRMVSERTVALPLDRCTCSNDAAAIARHLIGDRPVEHMIAILLDGRSRVTGTTMISQGGMHGCGVTARDVLRPVLVAQASAFVLAHNHPSGDPTPSAEDVAFTRRIKEAAEIVGVLLVDHVVVVADGEHRSVGA